MGPGRIQGFWSLVLALVVVSKPMAVTTGRRETDQWVCSLFLLLDKVSDKNTASVCDEQRGTEYPSVGSTAFPADGRILHMCKFFCHRTGRRPWELPGKKYAKDHLCLFSKYLMNSLVPICIEGEW